MKSSRIPLPLLVIVFAHIVLPLAYGGPSPSTQPLAAITIENFAFEPRELTVSPGTTVTWKNADDVPHTATSKDEPQTFDSGPIDTDESYSFTFNKTGTYAYYCKVHPHMTGVINVK